MCESRPSNPKTVQITLEGPQKQMNHEQHEQATHVALVSCLLELRWRFHGLLIALLTLYW
jgi:hypothetical protein